MGKTDVLVICNKLQMPLDEGGTKLTVEFVKSLGKKLVILNRSEEEIIIENCEVIPSPKAWKGFIGNIAFLIFSLLHVLKLRPDRVLFFPLSLPSLRYQLFASFLNIFSKEFAEVIFQVGQIKWWFPLFSRYKLLVISQFSKEMLEGKGLKVELFPILYKKPVKSYDKWELRSKYGFSRDDFIILHIGHKERNRGLQILAGLVKDPSLRVVLVLSSRDSDSFELDNKIFTIDYQVEDIYEIYALADVYLFPIISNNSSIDIPLSILEARELDLPIIATKIGAIEEALKGYPKGHLIHSEEIDKMCFEIISVLDKIREKDIET